MKKALLYLILVIGSGSSLFAQVLVFGRIISAESGKSLPFVNIILPERKMGTSADQNGAYSFRVDASDLEASVSVSCVGFKTRKLKVRDLIDAVISLETDTQALSAVEVYTLKGNKKVTINSFRGRKRIGLGIFSGGSYPSSLARLYEKPERFKGLCFLKSVEIEFFDVEDLLLLPAKFRLRILDVAASGKPGKDLLSENLIVQKRPNSRKVEIDLMDYKIAVPDNGFFC